MAFRLAELLNRADSDESVKESVADLIIRLWRVRSDWPNRWPPGAAARQLAWLFPPASHRRRGQFSAMDALMRDIVEELTREYRFWLRFSSSQGRELTSEEEAMLEFESKDSLELFWRLMHLDTPESAEDQPTNPDEELELILQTRRALLKQMLSFADRTPTHNTVNTEARFSDSKN